MQLAYGRVIKIGRCKIIGKKVTIDSHNIKDILSIKDKYYYEPLYKWFNGYYSMQDYIIFYGKQECLILKDYKYYVLAKYKADYGDEIINSLSVINEFQIEITNMDIIFNGLAVLEDEKHFILTTDNYNVLMGCKELFTLIKIVEIKWLMMYKARYLIYKSLSGKISVVCETENGYELLIDNKEDNLYFINKYSVMIHNKSVYKSNEYLGEISVGADELRSGNIRCLQTVDRLSFIFVDTKGRIVSSVEM